MGNTYSYMCGAGSAMGSSGSREDPFGGPFATGSSRKSLSRTRAIR